LAFNRSEELIGIATGVNQGGAERCFAPDQGAILLVRRNRNNFKAHSNNNLDNKMGKKFD
jgi:hypothetical protein